jgi:hypothetical protein
MEADGHASLARARPVGDFSSLFFFDLSPVITWLSNMSSGLAFFFLGSLLTGYFTVKIVVPRAMKNKDIQELKKIALEILEELKERRRERFSN